MGNSKIPDKYFISIKEAAIKIKPDNNCNSIGNIDKDVYVRSIGWNGEWLLIDVEYSNLMADSLDDINIHFSGWVNISDFEGKLDNLNKTELIKGSSCTENTTYFPEKDNCAILSDIWHENEKCFLLFDKDNIEFYKLPNIVYENKYMISIQIPFVVISQCKDWNGFDWIEIAYNNTDTTFQNGWIKKVDIISEKEKILQDRMIKKMEEIRKENAEEIVKIRVEIIQIMNIIDAKANDTGKITGKEDFDKRIKQLEIQKLNSELDAKLERLNIIQTPY